MFKDAARTSTEQTSMRPKLLKYIAIPKNCPGASLAGVALLGDKFFTTTSADASGRTLENYYQFFRQTREGCNCQSPNTPRTEGVAEFAFPCA